MSHTDIVGLEAFPIFSHAQKGMPIDICAVLEVCALFFLIDATSLIRTSFSGLLTD